MPCWRQSAGVAAPASCSCKTLTICSWVNRVPRMASSLGRIPIEDSHSRWTSFRGGRSLFFGTTGDLALRMRQLREEAHDDQPAPETEVLNIGPRRVVVPRDLEGRPMIPPQ